MLTLRWRCPSSIPIVPTSSEAMVMRIRSHRFAVLVLCGLLAAAGSAQVPTQTLANVGFTNQTGLAKDGLRLVFNQPLDPNQPSLVPGGGNVVPPFTTPPSYPSPEIVEFTGSVVPPGGRVPSTAGATMTFVASSTAGLDIVQATWQTGAAPTNTVALFTFYNFTGNPADTITFQVLDAAGSPMSVIDISFPSTFQPPNCITNVVGSPGAVNTLSTTCCVAGFGSPIGPIQLTFDDSRPIGEVTYQFFGLGAKMGSAADRLLINTADDGPLVSEAEACSIETSLPITQIFPMQPAPLDEVLGLGADIVYCSGGQIPPELGFESAHIVVTSNDTGPANISFDQVIWYRPATGPVPELIYYTFEEESGGSTANIASSSVGNNPAPVNGHLLGLRRGQFGNALVGVGGSSATSFVDTGWATSLPDGFTVSLWIRRGGASIPPGTTFFVFGDPSAQMECTANGTDLTLQVGPAQVTIPGGFPMNDPVVVLWTYSISQGFSGYLNGSLVSTVPVSQQSVSGSGPFKVGGSGTGPALPEGVIIDEFRLYDRDLTAVEVGTTFNSSLGAPTSQDQWQVNSPEAHLDVDGVQGDEFSPADVTKCLIEDGLLTIDSVNVGAPFEVVMTTAAFPMKPGSQTMMFLSDGQIVNVDVSDPNLSALNGFVFTVPFVPIISEGIGPPTPLDTYGQLIIASPGMPSGVALSAAMGLHFTDRGSQASVEGPFGDDSFLQVSPGAQPLCGPATVTFASTAYADLFVNSNGSVSFIMGDTDFSPSIAEFAAGLPKLAGLWTDLAPNLGGTITTTVVDRVVVVNFVAVPAVEIPGSANSVMLVFDTNDGSAGIFGFNPDAAHVSDTLVGLTPGFGATDPGPLTFAALVGLGLQFGSSTDMVYEMVDGGAPGGFYSVSFPSSDGSAFMVE